MRPAPRSTSTPTPSSTAATASARGRAGGAWAKVWTIARTELLRMLRDRSNVASMVIIPLAFVFVLGALGSEGRPTVAVAGRGPVADGVHAALTAVDAVEVRRVDGPGQARREVGAGRAGLAVAIPDDVAARWQAGEVVAIEVVSAADGSGAALEPMVARALADQGLELAVAARLAHVPGAPDRATIDAAVAAAAGGIRPVTVEVVVAEGHEAVPGGAAARTATQQLVLMVFLFTLYSAVPMAQARRLGVARRMLASPTSMATVVAGTAVGRWLVAVVQGAYIMAATAVLFGVAWGNLGWATLVLAAFSAVGAGLGTLIGASFDDDGLLIGVATLVGLVLAALGGAMLPAELFSGTMRTVSGWVPHSWAIEAFTDLRAGSDLGPVLAATGLLAAVAAVLLALAGVRLRARLRRG